MKIDAHQHFWNYDPVRDDWIDDTMSVLKDDFLPDGLKKEMDSCGIEGCVAVQADQSEKETTFLLDLAAQNPFIKGVVGWVDLASLEVESWLAFFSKSKLFKGVRHIVQAEPDVQFMLREDFKRGIDALSEFNFTYDILIYPKHLDVALELVSQFPEQPFVIDHMAKPEIKAKVISPWKEQMEELATAPNVYCKVSGLVTEADWHNWKEDDLKPYLDVVFGAFGTNRLMFGSDWPVCNVAGSYASVYSLVEEYLKGFDKEDREKIWGQNASDFYALT